MDLQQEIDRGDRMGVMEKINNLEERIGTVGIACLRQLKMNIET